MAANNLQNIALSRPNQDLYLYIRAVYRPTNVENARTIYFLLVVSTILLAISKPLLAISNFRTLGILGVGSITDFSCRAL